MHIEKNTCNCRKVVLEEPLESKQNKTKVKGNGYAKKIAVTLPFVHSGK